jgi:hypothetical protein
VKTWTLQTTLDSTGHLHLEVPVADGPQDVDVVLVVSARDAEARRADWHVVDAHLGALALSGDPAEWQRKLRAEWIN